MRVTRRGFLLGAIGVGVATTPAAWYGAVYEPKDVEIVRRRVAIPKLPSKLQGLTAVQISDLHLKGGGDVKSEIVDKVRELKPRVIFFTGDLIDDQSAL